VLLLADVKPDSAAAAARVELAEELLDDLRRVDHQRSESKKRLERVVAASGTSVIDIFGVGSVVANTVVGITGDNARFPTRDRIAAFNGTAPIEVSSGGRKVWRLSLRGNRTVNHAIRMAAVTQLRFAHSPGRCYHERKIAEGRTPKEALRALKRRISDALWVAMVADARRTAATTARSSRTADSGGHPGNDSPPRPALTPMHRLFGQATPEPGRRLRPSSTPGLAPRRHQPRRHAENCLTTKEDSFGDHVEDIP
jgi:transposase